MGGGRKASRSFSFALARPFSSFSLFLLSPRLLELLLGGEGAEDVAELVERGGEEAGDGLEGRLVRSRGVRPAREKVMLI